MPNLAGCRYAGVVRVLPPHPLKNEGQHLKADLKVKDKILMDFSTVASTQVKLMSHLRTSGAGDQSMTTTNNTTLLWTSSVTNETLAPALAESCWHHQGA